MVTALQLFSEVQEHNGRRYTRLKADPILSAIKPLVHEDNSQSIKELFFTIANIDEFLTAKEGIAKYKVEQLRLSQRHMVYLSVDIEMLEWEANNYFRSGIVIPYLDYMIIAYLLGHEFHSFDLQTTPRTLLSALFQSNKEKHRELFNHLHRIHSIAASEAYDPSWLLPQVSNAVNVGCVIKPIIPLLLKRAIEKKIGVLSHAS